MTGSKQIQIGFWILLIFFLVFGVNAFALEKDIDKSGENAKNSLQDSTSEEETIILKAPFSSPLFSNFPVAIVNGEPITFEELKKAVGTVHEGMSEGMTEQKAPAKRDYSHIIKRLINAKLILQEARNIGLDDLEEYKEIVDTFSRQTLVGLLQAEVIKDIKADEDEVEKLYKESVKEFKIRSLRFDKKIDAEKAKDEIKSGKSFEQISENLASDNTVKVEKEGVYLKNKELIPEIGKVASDMKVGSVSSVIQIGKGFVIFKVEEIRFPDNPKAKEESRKEVLQRQEIAALVQYNNQLFKKYVKLDDKLIKSIDFESKNPDFKKLLKDKRIIVQIKGEKPITVKEWAETINEKLFHGIEKAIESKKINRRKIEILDEMIGKKILRIEALSKSIDKTAKYQDMVKENKDSVLFGLFIDKVVVPELRVNEDEMKKYYESHVDQYTYDAMLKINSLVFKSIDDAENALDKLRKGSDFKWMEMNADGQVNKNSEGILQFESKPIFAKSLPEDVQKALSGVKSGDFRLYKSKEDGYFYLLYIHEVIPPKAQPFEEIKQIISKKVFDEKLKKAVEDWSDKLWKISDIKVYAGEFSNKY